jgi:hypothetical protein
MKQNTKQINKGQQVTIDENVITSDEDARLIHTPLGSSDILLRKKGDMQDTLPVTRDILRIFLFPQGEMRYAPNRNT